MNCDLYSKIRKQHSDDHFKYLGRTHLIKSFDKSCRICHRPSGNPSTQFQRFYQWVHQQYRAYSYSSLSEQYFEEIGQYFDVNNPRNLDTEQAAKTAISLVFSLGFTCYFEPEVIYQHILITSHNTNHFTYGETPPPNLTNMAMTADQLNALITQITTSMTNGFNGINIPAPPAAGSSIVKVDSFYEKDSEDTQEWIEMFLRVKEANGWSDNRRVAIAAGMLREEAADWYNLMSNTITR